MPEISGTKPVTAAQTRAIKGAMRRRQMPDSEYRSLLWDRWGVTTHKGLTRREASDLLRVLGHPLARRHASADSRAEATHCRARIGDHMEPARRLRGLAEAQPRHRACRHIRAGLAGHRGVARDQAEARGVVNDQSATYQDMLSAIEHVLSSAEYAVASRADRAKMIALGICAALAERRTIYVSLPSTIRRRINRAARNTLIRSMFRHGTHPNLIASRVGLSPKQVRRILHRHTETLD